MGRKTKYAKKLGKILAKDKDFLELASKKDIKEYFRYCPIKSLPTYTDGDIERIKKHSPWSCHYIRIYDKNVDLDELFDDFKVWLFYN